MTRRPVFMGALAALQLLGALLIQLYVIRTIGIGPDTDVIVAAQVVPLLAGAMVLAGLQAVWLPRLSVSVSMHSDFSADVAASQGQAMVLSAAMIAVLGLGSFWWTQWLFPVFSESQLAQARWFTVIFLVSMAFASLSAVLTFALRAQQKFVLPEAIGAAVTYLALLCAMVVVPRYGVWGAVGLMVLRSALLYLALLHASRWPAASVRQGWQARSAWQRMRPVLGASVVYKSSPLADRYFASQSAAGGLTLFNLAMVSMGSLAVVIERALCAAKAPMMSRHVSRGDLRSARAVYRRGLLQVSALSAAVLLALLAMERPVQWAASSALHVDPEASRQLWLFLVLLVGYAYGAAGGVLPVSLMHAMQETRLSAMVGSAGVAVSIGVKYFAFMHWGIWGLLVAASVHYVLTMVVMCLVVESTINARVA